MNFENEEIIIQVSKNADYRQGEKKSNRPQTSAQQHSMFNYK